MEKYNYPVYATQGGGLVREVAPNIYEFVEKPPDFPELGIGDTMPKEWDLAPANEMARQEIDKEQFG